MGRYALRQADITPRQQLLKQSMHDRSTDLYTYDDAIAERIRLNLTAIMMSKFV